MSETPNLKLTYLSAAQAQKHVTVNDSLRELDALVQLSVIDRDLATPPRSPSEGDRYIIATSGTGDWSGHDGKIAAYLDSAWMIYDPQEGWIAWVKDENIQVVYNGSFWQANSGTSTSSGAEVKFVLLEEELTSLTGASVTSTVAFPNQCTIIGVASRVTTSITGATSFDVGDGSTVDRFGGLLGVSAGSTNQGLIGPAGNYSSTTITITANGGNFTAGAVKIALAYIDLTPPTS